MDWTQTLTIYGSRLEADVIVSLTGRDSWFWSMQLFNYVSITLPISHIVMLPDKVRPAITPHW